MKKKYRKTKEKLR